MRHQAIVIAVVLTFAASACVPHRDCGIGQVPNGTLQACVTPPPCDGGTVNERNECVLTQGVDAADSGEGDAGTPGGTIWTKRLDGGVAGGGGKAGSNESGAGGSAGAPGTNESAGRGGGDASAGGEGGEGGSQGATPKCGDGMLDPGETCDGDCPTACPPPKGCLGSELKGTAAACSATCDPVEITELKAGDGCCPSDATYATDTDCPKSCGDGVITDDEKCEPTSSSHPCPKQADCSDNDVCTMDMVTGTAAQCTAQCVHVAMTRAAMNCDDGDPCTDDQMVESSTECTFECMHSTPRTPAGSCVDTDPCTDDAPVKSTTRCAYECPHPRQQPMAAACDDGDPCTDDTPEMSRTQCAYECPHNPLPDGTPCMTTGTCSSGRCQFCGDGVVNRGEECDPAATGWNSTTCSSACKRTMYKRCNANSQCSNGQSCWAGYCTTACSENTTPNGPGTECPRIPNVPQPFCYTNKCVLPCEAISDCPAGLDQCDNSATLGFSANGTTCSSTALGNP